MGHGTKILGATRLSVHFPFADLYIVVSLLMWKIQCLFLYYIVFMHSKSRDAF